MAKKVLYYGHACMRDDSISDAPGTCYHCDNSITVGSEVSVLRPFVGGLYRMHKACADKQHRTLEERLESHYGKPVEEIDRIDNGPEYDWEPSPETKRDIVEGMNTPTSECIPESDVNWHDIAEERMKDPEFRACYEEMKPELDLARAIFDGRMRMNMSQQELSDMTGVRRKKIAQFEDVNGNPDLKTLKRLAKGLGMTLKIELVPKEKSQ